jgi:hypothetical protein
METSMIDYSPLSEPVTEDDIRALQQHGTNLLEYPTKGAGKFLSAFGVLIVVVAVLLGWLEFDGSVITFMFLAGVLITVIGLNQLFWIHRTFKKSQHDTSALLKFVQKNGMQLDGGEQLVTPYRGWSFTAGDIQRILYRITPSPTSSYEIGVYQAQYNSMDRIFLSTFPYLKVTLQSSMPHIMLSNKSLELRSFGKPVTGLPIADVHSNIISLGEPIDTHFNVYAAAESTLAAQSFLSSELQLLLCDVTLHFTVEILNNEVYVYARDTKEISPHLMQRFFEIAELISGKK